MPAQVPRDMVGYGRRPPHPQWPQQARVALQFVLNYEEGGEYTVYNGDEFSETYLSEVVGIGATVGARNMNMESMYEFGSRVGFWRMHRLFTARKLPLTVFAVARALEQNPEAGAAMVEAGWEIATHGYRWIDYQTLDVSVEREHLQRAIEIQTQICGRRPVGCYIGRVSTESRRLIVEEGGFLYDADCYSDELPFWTTAYGRPHLIVPYTLDANDFRYAMPQGFNSGEQFFTYLKDTFDVLYAEGAQSPRLMSVGLHCRISGRPGRTAALARFLDYVAGHDRVWICRREDVARHWVEHFPH